MKPSVTACGAVLVGTLVLGLTACSNSSNPDSARIEGQAGATSALSAPAPTLGKAPSATLPTVAAPPGLSAAYAALNSARGQLDSTAAAVFAAGSDATLSPAMSAFSHDISVVQQKTDLAYTTGQSGNCAGSFTASRAASQALDPIKRDLGNLGRRVAAVTHARTQYATARRHALAALQQLYNAIAGHPLATGPSQAVAGLQQAMAYDDQATTGIIRQAAATLNAAHASQHSATLAVRQAALAPCLDVSA
jgi:hypothetical protein